MTNVPPVTNPEPIPSEAPVSGWPTVIGLIEIVFGAFGLLGSCGGLVMMMVLPRFTGMMEDMVAQGAPATATMSFDAMAEYRIPMTILNVVALAAAGLLLATGIATLRRRPFARTGAFAWAVIKMPIGIASSVLSYLVNQASFASMPEDDPAAAVINTGVMDIMSVGGACFGVVWSFALPVFLIIWYSRRKIREEVRGWDTSSRSYDVPGGIA